RCSSSIPRTRGCMGPHVPGRRGQQVAAAGNGGGQGSGRQGRDQQNATRGSFGPRDGGGQPRGSGELARGGTGDTRHVATSSPTPRGCGPSRPRGPQAALRPPPVTAPGF